MLHFLACILSSLPDNMIRFYLTHCPTIFLTILSSIILAVDEESVYYFYVSEDYVIQYALYCNYFLEFLCFSF